MEKKQTIAWEIIARRLKGELDEEEERVFQAWLSSDKAHRAYYTKAERMWTGEPATETRGTDLEQLIKRFDEFADRTPRRQPTGRRISRWVAVAAAMAAIAVGSALWMKTVSLTETQKAPTTATTNIEPGRPQARIILADGRTVNLTATDTTAIVKEEAGADIRVESGTVTYEQTTTTTEEQHNTIEIPRGGEYHLQLADGTQVWLNSDTRLRYPVAFTGKTRTVELQGEAYFEVTKDRKHPFIVRTAEATIEVYGTAFNVNAYAGQVQHTTLAEGSIGVKHEGREYRLQPGQQARFEGKSEEVEIRNVNAALYCSWHKGILMFENERLEDILHRLGVWYNVEVAFEDEGLKELHFTGDLERYADFADVLRMIAMTTDVNFKINGRQVFVCPGK